MISIKPSKRLFALFGVALQAVTSLQLAARTIEAEVLSVDASSYKAELRELGNIPEKTLTARMSPGDIALNWSGQRIRGELVGGEAAFMERIWPADPLKIKQAEGINRQLRRNTVERGRRVFRTNGEYMPPFALYNQSGALITHEHLKGKYTVLNFIFTRCQVATMCPAATTRMVRLQNDLADAGLEEKVRQVTITFDPQYDTPGILRGYGDARGIDPARFHLLTGDPQAIRDLCAQFGVQVKDVNKTLDHTMSTVLLDPNNKIRYRKTGSRWRSEDFLEFIQAMEN